MSAAPRLEPLKPTDAKVRARAIMEDGRVSFTQHARQELEADCMETTDCINVIRAGVIGPAEYENNEWRYRASTQRMCVVFTFASEAHLRIITAWRIQ